MSTRPRPEFLGTNHAERFRDPSVVEAYQFRPVYPEETFVLLERLLPHANHETKAWVKVDSDLDGLRSLPRYRKVLELIQ